ncbi:Hsp70 family protein, partial [Paenibacillus xylanexedens]|uniref:Hsp70 family protein n=1 Tax=Paenibacillus xylanexedens TaxID=528191 RepID=UPI0021B3CE71
MTVGDGAGEHLELKVRGGKFEEMCEGVVEGRVEPSGGGLSDGGMRGKDMEKMVLVGGCRGIRGVEEE